MAGSSPERLNLYSSMVQNEYLWTKFIVKKLCITVKKFHRTLPQRNYSTNHIIYCYSVCMFIHKTLLLPSFKKYYTEKFHRKICQGEGISVNGIKSGMEFDHNLLQCPFEKTLRPKGFWRQVKIRMKDWWNP